ncbi:hypothetical protein MAHJHV47_30990 [Mycobacterium avium subsp. hominissuis]
MGPTRLFPYDPPPAQRSAKERIRDAALSCFAIRGVAATSLRTVAEAAEVSVGLVQHHFGTKLALVAAVDQYVLAQVGEALEATALTDAPVDGLDDAGQRLTSLMAERPDVMSYLGRALAEGGTLGRSSSTGCWPSARPSATNSSGRAIPAPISIPSGRPSTH